MNSNQQKLALFAKVSLFAGLGKATLNKVAAFAKPESFRRGEQIFRKGAAGESLYVLVRGRVKIFSTVGNRSKTLALLEPGNFFGEMALLGEPSRSASALAIEDSQLWVLESRDFRNFLKQDPHLTQAVLKTLCERLRVADQEIEKLSFQNVLGRTAITLLDLNAKYGKAHASGSKIELEISHQELADLVGTAREVASRALARFKKMGAIEFDDANAWIIRDPEKLKRCIY